MAKKPRQDEPKTPELIENLRGLRKHGIAQWYYAVPAVIILLGVAAYKLDLHKKIFREEQLEQSQNVWVDYRGCKTESPYGDPPLLVRFADGNQAYVNFFLTAQLEPAKAEKASKIFRTPLDAFEALQVSVKGAVYSVLEKHTEEYTRANRTALGQAVIEATKPSQERTAYSIHSFDFLEFCTPRPLEFSPSNTAAPQEANK